MVRAERTAWAQERAKITEVMARARSDLTERERTVGTLQDRLAAREARVQELGSQLADVDQAVMTLTSRL